MGIAKRIAGGARCTDAERRAIFEALARLVRAGEVPPPPPEKPRRGRKPTV